MNLNLKVQCGMQVDDGRTFTEPSAIMNGDVENREQVCLHKNMSLLLFLRIDIHLYTNPVFYECITIPYHILCRL